MRVVIRHTEGCPNRAAAAESVAMALTKAGLDRAEPSFEVVSDEAAAQRLDFRGSPTILIDGKELRWWVLLEDVAFVALAAWHLRSVLLA